MFLKRLQALAQIVGFVVMGLLMISGAVSIFKYADHALGAPSLAEPQAAEAAVPLQQQIANIPEILNYAGELRNPQGQLMSGTYTMTFRIYGAREDEPSQALWSEVRNGIEVKNGRFALVLGERNPLSPSIFNGPERYFGLSVESSDGGSPISEDAPNLRKRFAVVPFAAQAGYASALMAADGDPLNSVYVNAQGNVGIGTLEPSEKLEIAGGDLSLWRTGNNATSQAIIFKPHDTGFSDLWRKIWVEQFNMKFQIFGESDEKFQFQDHKGNVYFTINGNGGNVGIGTKTPGERLEINQNGNLLLKATDEDPGDIIFQNSAGTQKGRIWSNPAVGSTLYLSSADNNPDITLDANGKVGIGTTIPTAHLQVKGNGSTLALEGVDHTFVEFFPDGAETRKAWLGFGSSNDNNFVLANEIAGANILLHPNNGRVGIGAWEPQATLHVNGDIRGKLQYTEETIWHQGEGAKQLIHKDQGFCFLTYVSGKFEGGGESVFVQIQGNFWVLGGHSQQRGVSAAARCAGVN